LLGLGIETADLLVHEDPVARLARPAGGRPLRRPDRGADESGSKRRERAWPAPAMAGAPGHAAIAWRFLMFQKESALRNGFRPARPPRRARICARRWSSLARKLLIALWRW